MDGGRSEPLHRRTLAALAMCLVLLTLVGVASNAETLVTEPRERSETNRNGSSTRGGDRAELPVIVENPSDGTSPRAELPAWVGWVAGIAVGAGALWFLTRQRIRLLISRRHSPRNEAESTMTEQQQAAAIADFADDLIDELELGPDPRIAIQRAYAAVETGFGLRELKRRPAETPLRYLDRIFGRRQSAGPPLRTLTDLFQLARFSDEPVDESMRSAAIEALRELRDQYRAVGRIKVFGQ